MRVQTPGTDSSDVVRDPPRRSIQLASDALDLRQQWLFLWLAVAVLLASIVLRVGSEGQVVLPLLRAALPDSCAFRRLSGYECPGCGLTRSFVSLAHGNWRDALHFNPAGPLWFGVLLAQIPYRGWQIHRLRSGQSVVAWRTANWLVGIAVAALFLQWIGRMLEGIGAW